MLVCCVALVLLLSNIPIVQAHELIIEEEDNLQVEGMVLESIPEDAVIIGEGWETVSFAPLDVDATYSTNELYDVIVHHQEFYSKYSGIGYVVEVYSDNKSCQMSVISGEAEVYDYSDYVYDTYPIYAVNYPPVNRISASYSTGLKPYPGTTDLYIGYDFYVTVVNGVLLNGGRFQLKSDKLTIPE